jgi:hypothetical protein
LAYRRSPRAKAASQGKWGALTAFAIPHAMTARLVVLREKIRAWHVPGFLPPTFMTATARA